MNIQKIIPIALCALCGAAMPLLSEAHGIWFAQRSGQTALVYGHGSEDLNLKPRVDKITSVNGWDANGQSVPVPTQATEYLYLVDVASKPAVLTATLDNGLWSKSPEGKWFALGKDDIAGATASGRYLKYAIHLRTPYATDPRAALLPVPDLDFQVLPQSDPHAKRAGDLLRLKVLFKGAPVSGANVIPDVVNDPDAKPLQTGRNGEVTVRIRNQGLNVISVDYRSAPFDAVKSNYTEHTGSLSFVLKHKPE